MVIFLCVFIVLFPYFLDSCVFTVSPLSFNGTVGSTANFSCHAINCSDVQMHQDGRDDLRTRCSQYSGQCVFSSCWRICDVTLKDTDNNTMIQCIGLKRPANVTYSETANLLVQNHLDSVTNIISHVNSGHIMFSWDIPPVLEGIEIVFSLLLIYVNDSTPIATVTDITTNSWSIELSYLDPCTLGNLTITATSDTLVSSGNLPAIIFPHQPPISSFTIKLYKHPDSNTSFLMEYKEQCDCPGKQSTHSTIVAHYKDHPSVSYSDIPVTIIGCIGIIKSNTDHQLELLGNEHVNVDVWLKNERGQTKQPSLEFNTKDIQNASYISGSASSGPCFQCDFENDVLVSNSHATGCNVTFLNVNTAERNHTLLYRGNGSSSVFDCFTWFLSGLYDICYTSLSFSEDCEVSQYSVYINGTEPEGPIKQTNKNHQMVIIVFSAIAFVIVLAIIVIVVVVVIVAVIRFKQNKKVKSPQEEANVTYQENSNEMVKPTTSLLKKTTVTPSSYGVTLKEQHMIAAENSNLTWSSDQNEGRLLINDANTRLHNDPSSIPLRDISLTDSTNCMNPSENETSFNQAYAIPVEVHECTNELVMSLGPPHLLAQTSLSGQMPPARVPSHPPSHILPIFDVSKIEGQQDNSQEDNNDEVFLYPEPQDVVATNTIQTSSSMPIISRQPHQPSFFRTNSETGDYHKKLSDVLEDNDFISFEALQ